MQFLQNGLNLERWSKIAGLEVQFWILRKPSWKVVRFYSNGFNLKQIFMVVCNLNVTVSQVQDLHRHPGFAIMSQVPIRFQLDLNLNSKHRQTCSLAAFCCLGRDAPPPLSHNQAENNGTRRAEAHTSPTWARSCVFPWSCAPVLGIVWETAWSLWCSLTGAPLGQSPRVQLRTTVATTVEFRPPKKFKLCEPVSEKRITVLEWLNLIRNSMFTKHWHF